MPKAVIDRARVEHVATLASLQLAPQEADALARELDAILGHVEVLETLDVEGVPPFAHAGEHAQGLRLDEPTPGLSNDDALGQAARVRGGAFAVPAFVE